MLKVKKKSFYLYFKANHICLCRRPLNFIIYLLLPAIFNQHVLDDDAFFRKIICIF